MERMILLTANPLEKVNLFSAVHTTMMISFSVTSSSLIQLLHILFWWWSFAKDLTVDILALTALLLESSNHVSKIFAARKINEAKFLPLEINWESCIDREMKYRILVGQKSRVIPSQL